MRESELLKHIYQSNPRLGGYVILPPGDDLAMLRLSGRDLLAGVDQLVENVHFTIDSTSLELVGRKAMTRSLSDIAAMAGIPIASLAAVTLPPSFTEAQASALFDAMRDTAQQFECPLVGGDIAIGREPQTPLVCSVTVLAEPSIDRPITRSGAQPGDLVYVTGLLGGSLESNGGGKHLTFEPRIRLAVELARLLGHRLHSMIDISDGLGRDASHIAELSDVSISLDAAKIPCTPCCAWRAALSHGEDYELCFTARRPVPREIAGVPIAEVGEVLRRNRRDSPRVLVKHDGQVIPGDHLGWQHESP